MSLHSSVDTAMNQVSRSVLGIASALLLSACGITDLDNYDAPESTITGRILYEGEPVGVQSGRVELELWQPEYELDTKIRVRVAQDGTFSAKVFDGSYEINLLPGSGPWVDDPTRIPLEVRGQVSLDIPVVPYHVIRDETVTFNPSGGGPHGTIDATFRVEQIEGSREVEYVGVYVGTTKLAAERDSDVIPNSESERLRDAISAELANNTPITISVRLPDEIYSTNSPARRDRVYVRIGVKAVGVAETLFTPVHEVSI